MLRQVSHHSPSQGFEDKMISPRLLLLAGEPCGFAATEPASTVKGPSAVWITRCAFSSSGVALATSSAVLTSWVVRASGAEVRSYYSKKKGKSRVVEYEMCTKN